MNCPICKKPVETGNPETPFCSVRCRTVDLGNWATGAYVIPVPLTGGDDDADQGGQPGEK